MSTALVRIPVGVIVTRSKAESQWTDYLWRAERVLVGQPETAPWTELSAIEDRTSFYAGSTELELYRTETANYRDNLAGDRALWVVLRPTDSDPPYQLFLVTADPAEGEAYTEAGNDLVEAVPMPDTIAKAIEAFVVEHHVEDEFFKRRRDRANPEALARREGGGKGSAR